MAIDPIDGDFLGIEAQRVIRESNNLIQRSNRLRSQTAALLNQSKGLIGCKGNRTLVGSLVWNHYSSLDWAVDLALRLTNATRGNLQLYDPASRVLLIAAQSGFKRKFLQHFECVHENEAAACGRAFKTRRRVIVEDVTKSTVFDGTPALDVLLEAGVRALQSTPLVSRAGAFLGMLSTHWPSPHYPSELDLQRLDLLARDVANRLEQS